LVLLRPAGLLVKWTSQPVTSPLMLPLKTKMTPKVSSLLLALSSLAGKILIRSDRSVPANP